MTEDVATLQLRKRWRRRSEDMKDVTAPKVVEVVIREDGKVIWINTEKGCVFRACRIGELFVNDERRNDVTTIPRC